LTEVSCTSNWASSAVVRLIDLKTTASTLEMALRDHPATSDSRTYAVDDLPRLARRLTAEAENELHLFLALVYRHGYHRLLIYPFRPETFPDDDPVPRAPDPSAL
jgi:hypothetical protein